MLSFFLGKRKYYLNSRTILSTLSFSQQAPSGWTSIFHLRLLYEATPALPSWMATTVYYHSVSRVGLDVSRWLTSDGRLCCRFFSDFQALHTIVIGASQVSYEESFSEESSPPQIFSSISGDKLHLSPTNTWIWVCLEILKVNVLLRHPVCRIITCGEKEAEPAVC